MDPMAGLDDAPSQGDTPSDSGHSKEVFDSVALQRNMQRVDNIRSVVGIASGCVAGIIGLTSLDGLSMTLFCESDFFYYLIDFQSQFNFSSLHFSVFSIAACDGLFSDMVLKNEFQLARIYKDDLLELLDQWDSTVRTFVHAILDFVLRSGLPLLVLTGKT